MIKAFKRIAYFPIAGYFRFFARIYLKRWNPKIIVITGSQGKTTLFSLLKAQFGENAMYAERSNSSFGIPFHILGLTRKSFGIFEWPLFAIFAPLKAFRKLSSQKIYIVEADCDRPNEGRFLATLLRPSVTAIISSSRTHSINFSVGIDKTIEQVTAHEFSEFAKYTKDIVYINADVAELVNETKNINAKIENIKLDEVLSDYKLNENGTEFVINSESYCFPFLLPKDVARSIVMAKGICDYFGISFDKSFSKLVLPPGRNTLLEGIKNVSIIDSSYNTSPESLRAMFELFSLYPKNPKWVVLGDMLELGKYEEEEHTRIADRLMELKPDRIILVGPRLKSNTFSKIQSNEEFKERVVSFLLPSEALSYLEKELKGGESVLFKGARFLEGIIEKLLANKADSKLLARREEVWIKRRKQWGL